MLKDFLGALWHRLPPSLRRRAVRFGQKRFTATAGAIILDDEGRLLLLDHVFRPYGGWGLPGGFLNRGEQPEEALRRELREEIGLELESAEFLFARTLRLPPQIEVYFRCRPKGGVGRQNFEIKGAAWFAPNELPRGLSPDQRRLIKRALSVGEGKRT